ncbi:MAG TPA: glycine betaine ABC transporter substrate-binding protein [Anaerolineaceae bacterium]|jgi:osmoprotectant transport system substrate-binding protein
MNTRSFYPFPAWLPRVGAAFLAVSLLLTACASPAAPQTTIRVGSKDFTEEFILGEMYAQVLENAGFKVERKLNLGGTPVAQQALVNNEIDLYPEYTGTGLLTVLKDPVQSDSQAVFNTVKDGYKKQFNLAWLDQSPMNDSQALAMTKEGSDKFGIKTFSDLVAKASQLVMVGAPEFQEREDGLPGMKKVYGDFTLKQFKAVDPGLRYQALTSGAADVVVAFSTDGEISAFNLVLLQDDKHMFPPYHVAPVVRQQLLDANPKVADILNGLAPKITDSVMSQLNYEVSGKKREPKAVAHDFLVQQGLIKQ